MNESGARLVQLSRENWDDFSALGLLAYEMQLRQFIGRDDRAAIIERLVELGSSANVPEGPGFDFPSTDIQERRRIAASALDKVDWQETGLLSLSGYRVGLGHGKARGERRRLLNYIFLKDDLRDIDDISYAQEWGKPMTSRRLQKLAEALAAFSRNAKRNPRQMHQAISDWEEDLAYLKATFYDQWGDFPWPDVEI